MKEIDAKDIDYRNLNEMIRSSEDKEVRLTNVLGQRFIGTALASGTIYVEGIPGPAMGSYLDGGCIFACLDASDAIGDTMNDGQIVVSGSVGDVTGYAMRGGRIFIGKDAGYRVGIHMKEYGEYVPDIVVGGTAGSYLGEYQAGGRIVVLGIGAEDRPCVGEFTATGMHGGKIYLRSRFIPDDLPPQVEVSRVTDKSELEPLVREFCSYFGYDADKLLSDDYFVLAPAAACIYKRMYTNRPM